MWDAILEYRMLSAPLAVKDVQEDLQEAMKEETGKVSEDAAASAGGSPLSAHEAGTRGQLHPMYQDTVFRWLDLGLRIESAAVATHKVELVATNSIPFVLRELQAQVSCDWSAAGPSAHLSLVQVSAIVPDLVSRVFQRVGRGGRHVAVSSAQLQEMARAEEFILVSRNLEQWRAGARAEAVDPGLVRNRLMTQYLIKFLQTFDVGRVVKTSQHFPPLLLQCGEAEDSSVSPPPTPGTAATPTTPLLTASSSPGLAGMLHTISTTSQVTLIIIIIIFIIIIIIIIIVMIFRCLCPDRGWCWPG